MKLTKTIVKQFETEQKQFGTHTALHNLLWTQAVGLFHDLGATSVRVTCGSKIKRAKR